MADRPLSLQCLVLSSPSLQPRHTSALSLSESLAQLWHPSEEKHCSVLHSAWSSKWLPCSNKKYPGLIFTTCHLKSSRFRIITSKGTEVNIYFDLCYLSESKTRPGQEGRQLGAVTVAGICRGSKSRNSLGEAADHKSHSCNLNRFQPKVILS